jgi:hypothetical protein
MDDLKLIIELVPSSCWWSNVRSNVTQAEWDRIRKEVYVRANYQCEICGGKGSSHPVECHEIWGYNLKTKTQLLVKFVALCPNCHEVKHMGLANVRGRAEQALSWFMKINKLEREKAMAHIKRAFSEWQQRSEMEWKLDVSLLSQYGIKLEKIDREQRRYSN